MMLNAIDFFHSFYGTCFLTGKKGAKIGDLKPKGRRVSFVMKVISCHLLSVAFQLNDQDWPSNGA